MCVWTLGFFGYFKRNSGPDSIMVVRNKDTRFQPYHFRHGSFSGNSDFIKTCNLTFIHVWTYRMFSIQFSCWDSAHLIWEGTHSDVLMNCCYGAWTKLAARSAANFVNETRCEMLEREVPIKPTKKKHGTFWHTANFLEHFLAHYQRTFWNFPFVSVRIISFLYYYCKQISCLKVRRVRRGSARIL